MFRTLARRLAIALALMLLAIQLVPYGHGHADPPVALEPPWDSPATRALAERACFDCHSNRTRWPWYSHVAPISWLVQHDVDEGRARLNVSEWDLVQRQAHAAGEVVREGEMPPRAYAWTHARSRLDAAERRQLADGLARTLGGGRSVHEDGTRESGPGRDDSGSR